VSRRRLRVDQVDLQALHRIRDQMVGNRTKLICPMRAILNAPTPWRIGMYEIIPKFIV
jgi:hypothetical protein